VNTLETGNADSAGRPFRGWMVGDLLRWAGDRDIDDVNGSPRDSAHLQIKWYTHPAGDRRGEWAPCDGYWSLTIAIDGDLTIDFRSISGEERQARLTTRGDYAMWHGPTWGHAWTSDGGAVMLTVRWPVELASL
jgi:hypothetical protein